MSLDYYKRAQRRVRQVMLHLLKAIIITAHKPALYDCSCVGVQEVLCTADSELQQEHFESQRQDKTKQEEEHA